MKGIIIKFIRAGEKGHFLGLILLAVAGISAGCSTRAEIVKPIEPPKKETTATVPTPEESVFEDPYPGRRLDGDMEYSTPKPEKSAAQINRASFEKIKIGMTLGEVEKLLGEKGMLVGINDVNGRKTQIYKWTTDGFSSYIDVVIENGKVAEKKDKNLK